MSGKELEYKGPSETVAALGQASVDGTFGGLVGGAVGGAVGASLHNNETSDQVTRAIRTRAAHIVGAGRSVQSPEIIETVDRVLSENQGGKRLWHVLSRKTKVLVGAMVGMIAVSAVVQAISLVRGEKRARAGKQQFEDIMRQNEVLQQQLRVAGEDGKHPRSFVDALNDERSAITRRRDL